LFTEIEGPRGPFQVFCTHLSWRADWSGVRQAQIGAVCEVVRRHSPRQFPAILCGDLNAEPVSDEIRMLTGRAAVPVPGVVFHDAWEAAGEGASATISRRNPYCEAALDPEMRIDYVMVGWAKSGGAGQVLHARVAGDVPDDDGVVGSDHYAVVAELRY
jgi:endonuclease/exonuclease/phosphatase family metal-dependent hydrolase